MEITFWLHLLYYAILLVTGLVGIVIAMLGLPGLWLMVIAAGVYAIATGGTALHWPGLVALVVLGLVAELLEFLAGAAGSKNAGGGWRGIVGAIVGGIAGAIVGVPIPVIGPLIGAVLGAGVGAALLEFSSHNDAPLATQIGWGAAKGRMWGIAIKATIGLVMLAILAVVAFPDPPAVPLAPPPEVPVPAEVPAEPAEA